MGATGWEGIEFVNADKVLINRIKHSTDSLLKEYNSDV
jgi:hypothetical protein